MKEYESIEEMMKWCEENQKENEEIVFALGTGRMLPIFGKPKVNKGIEKATEIIKNLDGFIGVNTVDIWHTALIFDTLNNAKIAKNIMKTHKLPVGNVVPVLMPKRGEA